MYSGISFEVKFIMALFTNRNYVKPMFWCITKIVMIFLGLIGTIIALQTIRSRKFTISDSVSYSTSALDFFRVFNKKDYYLKVSFYF